MRSTWCSALLAGVAFGALHGAAQATPCYFVYNRADTVIYRDAQPPVDMSDPRRPLSATPCGSAANTCSTSTPTRCAPARLPDRARHAGNADGRSDRRRASAAWQRPRRSGQGSASPGQGGAPSTRVGGVTRGGVGVTRTQPAGKGK